MRQRRVGDERTRAFVARTLAGYGLGGEGEEGAERESHGGEEEWGASGG